MKECYSTPPPVAEFIVKRLPDLGASILNR